MTSDFQILKRLYDDYTKKYVKKIILSVFFTVLLAGSTSSVAYLLDPAIKELFIEQKKNLILIIPGLIVLAFIVKGTSLYLAKIIMIGVSADVTKDIQVDIFKSILLADSKLIENKHSGKFISNLSNDVAMITNLVSTVILNFFKDSLTLIGLLGVMFYQNWKLTLFAIIMIPIASLAAKSLGKRIGKVTGQQMKRAGILNAYLIEILKNHKIAKIFQRENYEQNRANEYIEAVKETSKKINIVFVRASPIMEVLTGIMIAILIYLSAILIAKDELEVSNFFSFLAAMMLAYQPVRSLATLNIAIQQGLEGAKSVLPVIDYIPEVQDRDNSKELVVDKGEIDFEKINFNYSQTESIVLNSINLKIPGKKMTALVGHSGAGKSTILNLIPRFYDAKSGDIKIDKQSIYNSSLYSLRRNISLVSQDTTLFDDTIFNNIQYANKDASLDEVIKAAEYSFASEFIEKLPNKYDTLIGENGVRLSGGEKQRLSIARAILKKSPIILLDEATSSLDAETESKIQKAINFLTKGRTTIVIAHRLSTILNSDVIYVIDKGKVTDHGKHDELLKNSITYKNFYEKQLKRS
ncbi:ABC transporter transmembrane domain-containing protein [Candidatus Pelagibacter sp.]|nr:ABC transporter transmembrane domain-containing protein [Candidatus Pelagibacter sp.]MDA9710439.1 ABC transporter transmembrane domain-containing protein [Candidatus Pelagibacter sp.]|tara:strand:+ start:231 stop:1973 length:1743 start_codon:yes stop_codon:yes gene_type:complete